MALGAFLAGMVVGRSDFSLRAASEALPMRDAFAVLFFVSVGMLLRSRRLLAVAGPGARPRWPSSSSASRWPRLSSCWLCAIPLRVGAGRRGRPGADRRILLHPRRPRPGARRPDRRGHQRPGRAAIVSISLNPLLYRLATAHPTLAGAAAAAVGGLVRPRPSPPRLDAASGRRRPPLRATGPWSSATARSAGPSSRLLRDNGVEPTVVEMNLATVRALRDDGVAAIYGDARTATRWRPLASDAPGA